MAKEMEQNVSKLLFLWPYVCFSSNVAMTFPFKSVLSKSSITSWSVIRVTMAPKSSASRSNKMDPAKQNLFYGNKHTTCNWRLRVMRDLFFTPVLNWNRFQSQWTRVTLIFRLLTLFNAFPEFQQWVKWQGSNVGFTPSLRSLFHILLKLDPTRLLLPLKLRVLSQEQLVQLHEQLQDKKNHISDLKKAIVKQNYFLTSFGLNQQPNKSVFNCLSRVSKSKGTACTSWGLWSNLLLDGVTWRRFASFSGLLMCTMDEIVPTWCFPTWCFLRRNPRCCPNLWPGRQAVVKLCLLFPFFPL